MTLGLLPRTQCAAHPHRCSETLVPSLLGQLRMWGRFPAGCAPETTQQTKGLEEGDQKDNGIEIKDIEGMVGCCGA